MISKGSSYNTTYFIWQNDENQTVPCLSSLIPRQFSANVNFVSSNSTSRKTVIFFS